MPYSETISNYLKFSNHVLQDLGDLEVNWMISELINHRSLQRVLNLLLSPSRRCPAQWLCGGHNYCQRTNCGGLHNYKILHSFPLKTKSMLDLINLPLCHSHKVVVFKAGEFYYFCQFLLVAFF